MGFRELLATADAAVGDHLGGPVQYAPAVGAPVQVTGVFDQGHVQADAGEPGVTSVGPAVFLRLEDLPTDPEDDTPTITVSAVAYRVKEVKRDGMGGVLILLYRE